MKEREEELATAKKAAKVALKELNTAQKPWETEPKGQYVEEKDTDLQYLLPNAAEPIIRAYQAVSEASKAYVGLLKLQLNGLDKENETEKANVLAEIAKYSAQGAKANRHLAECLANCLNNGQYDLLVAKSDGEVTPPQLAEGVAAPAEGLVNTKLVAEKIKEHVEAAKQCQKDASAAVKRLESLEFFNTGMPVLEMSAEEMSKEQLDKRTKEIRDAKVAAQQNLNEAKKASQEAKKQSGVFKTNVKQVIQGQKQGLDGVLKEMEKALKQNLAQHLQSEYQEVGELVETTSADRTDTAGDLEAVGASKGSALLPQPSLAGILPKTKEERLASKRNDGSEAINNDRTEARDALKNVLNEYEDKILKHITLANYDKAIAKLEKNLDSSPMVAFYRFAEAVSIRGTAQTYWRKKAEAARMRGMVKEIRKNVKEVVPGEGTGNRSRGFADPAAPRRGSTRGRRESL